MCGSRVSSVYNVQRCPAVLIHSFSFVFCSFEFEFYIYIYMTGQLQLEQGAADRRRTGACILSPPIFPFPPVGCRYSRNAE